MNLTARTAREAQADYVEAIELVEPASVPRVVVSDVDDDQVIRGARRSIRHTGVWMRNGGDRWRATRART